MTATSTHQSRWPKWTRILNARLDRHATRQAISDFEELIREGRTAIRAEWEEQAASSHHPDEEAWADSQGIELARKYGRERAAGNLDEAIRIERMTLEAAPADYPDRAILLNQLAGRIRDRYKRGGQNEDLDDAIHLGREIQTITTKGDPKRIKGLNTLAIALHDRYSRTGAFGDLQESILIGQEIITTTLGYPERGAYMNNFAVALHDRYSRLGTLEDLNETIRIERDIIQAGLEHPSYDIWLNNLATALSDRFSELGELVDLDDAIQIGQRTLDIKPNHPSRSLWMNNLGVRLQKKYLKTNQLADLEKSIELGRNSIDFPWENYPDRAIWLNNFANRLYSRYLRTGNMEDLELAISHHHFVLSQSNLPITTRLEAGDALVRSCASISDWRRAYEALTVTMDLVPRLTIRSLENSDKQYLIREIVGLASDAAAVALNAGKGAIVALEFLELGRGVLAASMDYIRADLKDLQAKHPELAEQFDICRDKLDFPVHRGMLESEDRDPQMIQRYDAGLELDRLVDQIREQSGFEQFLRAPTRDEIQCAASNGPIVIVNISQHRCDAIIVEEKSVHALALPSLVMEDIKIYTQINNRDKLRTSAWLWDAAACPVLQQLGLLAPPLDHVWPRMWWILTGPLSQLPIHAAGLHGNDSTSTVLDCVISSYSTSVKAIIQGRKQKVAMEKSFPASAPLQALLVAVPDIPGIPSLTFAREEVNILINLCKSMAIVPIVPQGQKQDIVTHLPNSKIFHFAGHGSANQKSPLQSYLLLEDWQTDRLTMEVLMGMNLAQEAPFLAYLSACGTGQIKDNTYADEGLHLISACQLAGFRHVIGTLWEVNDETCVDMARMTYESMRDCGITDASICKGLHDATRTLRNRWLKDINAVHLCQDQTTAQQNNAVLDQILERDIGHEGTDGEEDDVVDQMLWVPYVHYGV
jgi:tetratricopeptide (TPR) repeat protein